MYLVTNGKRFLKNNSKSWDFSWCNKKDEALKVNTMQEAYKIIQTYFQFQLPCFTPIKYEDAKDYEE